MKTIFDLSVLEGVLNNTDLENKVKEEIKKNTEYASDRERFFYIPIAGNTYDKFAFEFLNCYIALHLKRIYSAKRKPIKDIYTIEAFKIEHAKRISIYDDFTNTEYKNITVPCLSDIEHVDETGKLV